MKSALCILGCLAGAGVVHAAVEVRIWMTDESPAKTAGGPINFAAGYGPLTPFAVQTNDLGTYDVHRNYVSSSNPGSVLRYKTNPPTMEKFDPTQIPDPVEQRRGTPPFEFTFNIWAAFCGDGWGQDQYGNPVKLDPLKPGIGWENAGVRVTGLDLKLVSTGDLTLEPHWYQYENGSTSTTVNETRWFCTSDMSGNEVTLVGLGFGTPESTGWYGGATNERMQTWATDVDMGNPYGTGDYGAGGILLGAVEIRGNFGDVYIGLGHHGIATNTDEDVLYFPGTEDIGIPAGMLPDGSPVRLGATPEAVFLVPEAATSMALSLGLVVLRRRRSGLPVCVRSRAASAA